MNRARVTASRRGRAVWSREESVDPLAFRRGDGPAATIGFTVGKATDFGALKVSAHVTLTCDQDEATVHAAGATAFRLAVAFASDAMQMLTATESE